MTKVWDSIFKEKEWGKYPEIELVRFIARNYYKVKDRKLIRVLDLGCGPGAHTWYLAREGFDVYSIDSSKVAMQLLVDRMSAENLSFEPKICDIKHLPYPDDFFDLVIDVECITHNEHSDIKKILLEAYRVLGPRGKLYSQFFGKQSTESQFEVPAYSLTREEIPSLFDPFIIRKIDRINRTDYNMKIETEEYIIVGERL